MLNYCWNLVWSLNSFLIYDSQTVEMFYKGYSERKIRWGPFLFVYEVQGTLNARGQCISFDIHALRGLFTRQGHRDIGEEIENLKVIRASYPYCCYNQYKPMINPN